MVAQRCARVAHAVFADGLRAVDMPQRRVAKVRKMRCIDSFYRADVDRHGFAAGKLGAFCPGNDHLVRHQNPALGGRHRQLQRGCHGGVIVGDVGIGQKVAHRRGTHKGQQAKFNFAVVVRQHDLTRRAGKPPGQVDALPCQQLGGKIQTLGAVVVAGHRQHRHLPRRKLGQKPVQQRAGSGGRHGVVVDIARQHDRLDLVFVADVQHLLQNKTLILQKIEPVDPLAQVQIRKMQKFHRMYLFGLFTATAFRRWQYPTLRRPKLP